MFATPTVDNNGRPLDPRDAEEFNELVLRKWYAGQAMANPSLCTGKAPEWQLQAWFGGRNNIYTEEIAARQAVEFAKSLFISVNKW